MIEPVQLVHTNYREYSHTTAAIIIRSKTMPLKGVYEARTRKGDIYYRSSITYRRRHISLGSYENEVDAHGAYLEADEILKNPALSLVAYEEKYSGKALLSFDKVVSLINFRDNGIYISKPVYLYRKFFEYYLSPERILKFDRDDLFYYSSHKIMERGGRLFVADYGMQVGIHSRYGIKPYAVEGRDYAFVNGDKNDFRYENIKILNSYNGVEIISKKGRPCYKARIHINGNILIGTYETDTQAAIAYNKAIDLLSRSGRGRAWTPNYIPSLSREEYLKIYDSIELSDYFKEL